MAAPELLVATKNRGKISELEELLSGLNLKVLNLARFPQLLDVAETGLTFIENALIKARYYHKETGLLSLSDDSGLEVDALNGAPGLYSARYAGPAATDQQRYEKLLSALIDVTPERRTARFVCAIALVGPLAGQDIEQTFIATAEGRILLTPRGENGFGYDPIFEFPLLSKSFAELSRAEKARYSHRGQALTQVREFLSQRI